MKTYLFVSTDKAQIADRCSCLETTVFRNRASSDEPYRFFLTNSDDEHPHFLVVINDLADHNPAQEVDHLLAGKPGPPPSDSLCSFAHLKGARFLAKTDFWGVHHHYFYHDNHTFICSSNLFLIAGLIDAKLSNDSLFEYLFFLAPLNEHSWFENIRLLKPDQHLLYNSDTDEFKLSPVTDINQALTGNPSPQPIAEATSAFFKGAANGLAGRRALISLSSGTDSRTVLAGMLQNDILERVVSFGRDDLLETQAINRFADKYCFASTQYDYQQLLCNWEENYMRGMIVTQGLLNPTRVHYANYYKTLEGVALFEGIIGSQFVKGEIAIGGTTTEFQASLLQGKADLPTVIENGFGCLPVETRSRMIEYIADVYGNLVKPVYSESGREEYARFLFNFVPSRIFSPVIQLATEEMKGYFPFLSRRLLQAVFKHHGIVHYSTLDGRFPGTISCLKPECEMVRSSDRRVYTSLLDRMVSFREVEQLPTPLLRQIRRLRLLRNRFLYHRMRSGQVNHHQLRQPLVSYLEHHEIQHGSLLADCRLGQKMLKQRAMLVSLNQLQQADPATIVSQLTTPPA